MKYISIKLHDQEVAFPIGKYIMEPTQINKIKPLKVPGLKIGEINLRGQNIDVLDISKIIHKRNLKRFDGLLIVHEPDTDYGIVFEGFFKVKTDKELNGEKIIELDSIKKNFK